MIDKTNPFETTAENLTRKGCRYYIALALLYQNFDYSIPPSSTALNDHLMTFFFHLFCLPV